MGSQFGQALRLSLFGQSHSAAVGCCLEGLPAGWRLDFDQLKHDLSRRAGGKNPWTTPRSEPDEIEFLGGLNQQQETCGAPLALIIKNTNTRSADYDELARIPRPGHADYVAYSKWAGHNDVAGGGHFSGRITAALVAAGSISRQILSALGITTQAHILSVGSIHDQDFCALNHDKTSLQLLQDQIEHLQKCEGLPVFSESIQKQMIDCVMAARENQDSVGGIIECVSTGLPLGLGEPMFDGIESKLATALFGLGGVKGLEFGEGFKAATMLGSEHNDAYELKADKVSPKTNHAGGNLGGITTGAPLYFKLAIKPTSSIAQSQESVDIYKMSEEELQIHGRHDPCIALRIAPVVEAVTSLVLLDLILMKHPNFEDLKL